MEKPALTICRDADQLAETAVDFITRQASAAIAQRGRFSIALTGGSTPGETYRRWAHRHDPRGTDWTKTYFFFGDERWVRHDDERSNYKLAQETLLAPAAIAPDHVFAMPTDLPTPREAAEHYAATLQNFFAGDDPLPVIDLVLLGLGEDGHVASLFPGAASLAVDDSPVTWSPPGTLPPSVDRVTLTYPAINAARQVLFLVSGGRKARPFADVWLGRAARDVRPAVGVRPTSGGLAWLVDAAAASEIAR
ncbi:MAG TPA: 6-phosphogluconolactonase [Pirellulales bacterium]|nr:6-phosphogluconolactonase [Pirellulales bacterium]